MILSSKCSRRARWGKGVILIDLWMHVLLTLPFTYCSQIFPRECLLNPHCLPSAEFVIESSALAKKKDEPGVSKFDGEKDLSPTSSAFFPPACSDAIIGSWPVNQNCSFKAKYLLDEKLLGKGAYSNVMSGRSLSNNNQVAVKIIDKVNLMEAELDRLEREVEILKKISHKNILGKHMRHLLALCIHGQADAYACFRGSHILILLVCACLLLGQLS